MCLGLALVTGASPASARTAVEWTITTVTEWHVVNRASQTEWSVRCPSGKTPVSGGYTFYSAQGWDGRRMYESTEFGSGQHYLIGIDDEIPHNGGASDIVTATVNCVSMSLFSNSTIKTTNATVGSDHLATAIANCDPGWYALSADVGFG